MLEGVVQRGTGQVVSEVGKPLAGKTGTTNDSRDAWFVGFSPDLAVGVFIGFDEPTPLGRGESRRDGGGAGVPRLHEGGAGRPAGDARSGSRRTSASSASTPRPASWPAPATAASSSRRSSRAPRRSRRRIPHRRRGARAGCSPAPAGCTEARPAQGFLRGLATGSGRPRAAGRCPGAKGPLQPSDRRRRTVMKAEIEAIVGEIKGSLQRLRRHL